MNTQKLKKLQGNLFVVLIICIICFIYFCNVKLVWIDRRPSNFWTYLYLIIFNLFSFMLAWSLIVTMFTDPGRVPQNWGYFLDDHEHKKRRYCLICHIFKPERCHHCSACNRCVLNMDHHCPWLGNCIGFKNRKFFILLLFYVNVTTWLAMFGMIGEIFNIMVSIKQKLGGDDTITISWFSDFLIVASFGVDITAMVIIGIFFKFHLDLIFMNTTTLENLDRKRNNSSSSPQPNNYDMGQYYNFVQVFGSNVAYWPFPFFLEDVQPVGDGVVWPQRVKTDTEAGLMNNNNSSAEKTNNTSHQYQNGYQENNMGNKQTNNYNSGQQQQQQQQQYQQQQQQQQQAQQYGQARNFNNNNYNGNFQAKQQQQQQQQQMGNGFNQQQYNQGYQQNNKFYRNQF
ncbi:hypothetical protein ABPG72_004916 [Tetrahymena utriculariae]